MNLKEKLQAAWNNKGTIMEGFYNAYVSCNQEVKDEALKRLELCRTNQCGFHDPKGQSEKAVFKGKESCGGCGCDLFAKAHAMSAQCYLGDIDPDTAEPRGVPVWTAVMTHEQEMEINKIAYNKQFENRK
jgi:hypothetical protein